LNPAHLKALLGQEVSMTLSDGSTRQGTVYSLDPESLTIVLATSMGVRGGVGPDAWKNGEIHGGEPDACVVVPGHAVAAVEVVGGNALALDALNGRKTSLDTKKTLKSTNSGGLRTVSWGENSSYAGMEALLKPTASKQLDSVKRCLRENMVPFTERQTVEGPGDVELLVLGSLIVSHPYTADSCSCPNEIVLARIRELIAEVS
jgi:small nuclear ribonucleoprotein (snRNP)-like protein